MKNVAFAFLALVVCFLSPCRNASAAPPEGTLYPVITSVANYSPDFQSQTDVYRALLAAIPAPGLADFFSFHENLSPRPMFTTYTPLTTNVSGQPSFRTYAYRCYWFFHEYWIGTNKQNGFFLFSTSITIIGATLTEEEEVFNTSDLYKQSFTCVFKSQNGTYDDVKQNLILTACNDSTLIPVVFELSATNCYFTWKQAGKNFAYGEKLYTVSDSNFSTRFPADLYQLKENTWPSIFALYVRYAGGWSTQNVQFFTVAGRRILPRMWYRTSNSDIAWPASFGSLDGGLTTNNYPLTDTDGGGQFDFSEYFYLRDPLDAQDDDPNYTQADPSIINIAIDNGYVSIDNEQTDLPATGDVNIEANPEGRSADIRTQLESRLASNGIYSQVSSILTGVPTSSAEADLPRWEIPSSLLGGLGGGNRRAGLALDFNVIKQNQSLWRIFQAARLIVDLILFIVTFMSAFNSIIDVLKA